MKKLANKDFKPMKTKANIKPEATTDIMEKLCMEDFHKKIQTSSPEPNKHI